jgi:hypothetical protein
MPSGEWLTRATIRIALLLYTVGAILLLLRSPSDKIAERARAAWTIGCLFFVAHVLCAFAYYHHWSHAAALAETARQTQEMTGSRSGGGLYLNYLFGAVWIVLTVGWWINPRRFLERPRWSHWLWNGFALFMIINGTIVFGRTEAQWFGLALCISLAIACYARRRANETPTRR